MLKIKDYTPLNKQWLTALFIPVIHSAIELDQKESVIRTLLRNPQKPGTDDAQNTVLNLMVASPFSQELIAATLTAYPEHINKANNHGLYPIHTAILNNRALAVNLLLSQEGVPQQQDHNQQNALHYIVRYGNLEMLEHGWEHIKSHINDPDDTGHTPLDLAQERNDANIIQFLRSHNAVHGSVADVPRLM